MGEHQDIVDDRLVILGGKQAKRRHRCPADAPPDGAEQVLAKRLGAISRGGEFEDARAIIAGLGNHIGGRDSVAVARDAVALNAVARINRRAVFQVGRRELVVAEQLGRLRRATTVGEDGVDLFLQIGLELLDLFAVDVRELGLTSTAGGRARESTIATKQEPTLHGGTLCVLEAGINGWGNLTRRCFETG